MLYDYKCPNCGVFEVKRSIHEKALTTCPTCGADIYQLFSPPTIVYVPFYDVETDEIVTHRS